jgi:hypothetical protein
LSTTKLTAAGISVGIFYTSGKVYTITRHEGRDRGRDIALLIPNVSVRWSRWSMLRSGRFTTGNELRYLMHSRLREKPLNNFSNPEEHLTCGNIYRPEIFDSEEPFCRHLSGGCVKIRNEHRHNTTQQNLKYEMNKTEQRGSWQGT